MACIFGTFLAGLRFRCSLLHSAVFRPAVLRWHNWQHIPSGALRQQQPAQHSDLVQKYGMMVLASSNMGGLLKPYQSKLNLL